MTDERLTDLEIKTEYIERSIEKLDEVIRGLSTSIEELRREVAELRGRAEEDSDAEV